MLLTPQLFQPRKRYGQQRLFAYSSAHDPLNTKQAGLELLPDLGDAHWLGLSHRLFYRPRLLIDRPALALADHAFVSSKVYKSVPYTQSQARPTRPLLGSACPRADATARAAVHNMWFNLLGRIRPNVFLLPLNLVFNVG